MSIRSSHPPRLFLACKYNNWCDEESEQIFGVICNKLPAPRSLMTRVPRTHSPTRVRARGSHVASHLPTIRHFLRWLGHNDTQWDHVQRRNTSSISTQHPGHLRIIISSNLTREYFWKPSSIRLNFPILWGVFTAGQLRRGWCGANERGERVINPGWCRQVNCDQPAPARDNTPHPEHINSTVLGKLLFVKLLIYQKFSCFL